GVRDPTRLRAADLRAVAALRRGDQIGGDQDVLAEELSELRADRLAVEGLDGIADVGLVAEQPRDGGARVGRIALEADDREPRPRDVVLPELAHVLPERDRLLRPQERRRTRHRMLRMGDRTRSGHAGADECKHRDEKNYSSHRNSSYYDECVRGI